MDDEPIEAARPNNTPPPAPTFGSVANPIRMMLQAFDADLAHHVELGDEILFRPAMAMEKEAAGRG